MPICYLVSTDRRPAHWPLPVVLPDEGDFKSLHSISAANEAGRMVAALKEESGDAVTGVSMSPSMGLLVRTEDPKRPGRVNLSLCATDAKVLDADREWLLAKGSDLDREESSSVIVLDTYCVRFASQKTADVILTSRKMYEDPHRRLAQGLMERLLSADPTDWSVALPIANTTVDERLQTRAFEATRLPRQLIALTGATLLDATWAGHGFAYLTETDGELKARFVRIDDEDENPDIETAQTIAEATRAAETLAERLADAREEATDVAWEAKSPTKGLITGIAKGVPHDR